MDMSETIKEDYRVLAVSGIQPLAFVFLCLIFFVGMKESFIATLAIPLAFLITFIYLNNSGSSLNFMTNFSLVLTLGIAIDTTIVIIE
jgi:multidrug efflux pump subunit AcrB